MEYAKIGLLLAKVETTFGTDAAPTSAANNIPIARGLVPVEPDGTPITRELLDGGFARVAGPNTLLTMTFKVRFELRGNRTNGTAADISAGLIANVLDFDPLLRACDLPATYVAESGAGVRDGMVIYQPVVPTSEGTSLTIWAYTPQKLYKAVGCKGTIDNIAFTAGGICFVDATFMGAFSSISDASPLPTDAVWPALVPPLWAVRPAWSAQAVTLDGTGNTVTLTAHGLFNGDRFKLGGTLPAELALNTWYYVKARTANTLQIAATLNGAAIDFTGAGSGVTLTSAGGILWDGWSTPVIQAVNIKLGQVLTTREDGNTLSGLKGHIITDRVSTGDLKLESSPEATHPIWADYQSGRVKYLRLNLGSPAAAGTGNRVAIEALTRLTKVTYEDMSGKRMQNCQFDLVQSAPGIADGSEFKLIVQ
jgi:hypothetical protein